MTVHPQNGLHARLRELAPKLRAWISTLPYEQHGDDDIAIALGLVYGLLPSLLDAAEERDAALAKLAAVKALLDEWDHLAASYDDLHDFAIPELRAALAVTQKPAMNEAEHCQKGLCPNRATRLASLRDGDGKVVAVIKACDECGGEPFAPLPDGWPEVS